jgi:hypothetical protein
VIQPRKARFGHRLISITNTGALYRGSVFGYPGETHCMNRLVLALVFTGLLPSLHAAAPASAATQLPVVGSVTGGGTMTGTLSLTKFSAKDGQLVAVGTIAGTVTNAAGVVTTFLQNASLPVSNLTGSCEILHLDLGPISLDVLGLKVDLSRIVLDITAQSGAGNLLGNLLCAVVNLLNNSTGLATLLNQILALL